jgi:hypothetical protein
MAHLDMIEMHGVTLSINVTPAGAATWAELREGIDNMQEALNEVVNQFKFMSDNGFSRSRVSGMAPVWTLSGRRIFGNVAQDYIATKQYGLGSARETQAKVEFTAGGYDYEITFDCTLANVSPMGGATTDVPQFGVEVHVDGEPTLSTSASSPTTEISAVLYDVTAPVKDATAQTTHTDDPGYTSAIEWSPDDETFSAATVYTATVTYTAAAGYAFALDFDALDVVGLPTNATSITVYRASASSLVITVVYAATAA